MHKTTSEPSSSTDPNDLLPETVQLTAATIRGWRKAGYRVSEERVAPWLYLRAGTPWPDLPGTDTVTGP